MNQHSSSFDGQALGEQIVGMVKAHNERLARSIRGLEYVLVNGCHSYEREKAYAAGSVVKHADRLWRAEYKTASQPGRARMDAVARPPTGRSMMDNGDLKPGTLCYVHGYDPFAHGKVVEVIGPYMGTDVDNSDRYYEVWADWLNNGTWGAEKRGMPRRVLHPINPPGVADSVSTPEKVGSDSG